MAAEMEINSLKEKIDQLNLKAWQIRVNDSPEAHLLCQEAIKLSEEINYDKGKAEGYRTFALILILLSRQHEALEYCKKSLPLFEALNDLDEQASIYGYFGIIERSFGNYAENVHPLP